MITIVEPKERIISLWGKQRVKNDKIYRLMRYVLRVNLGGEVLLHNVVTGCLVVLEKEEAEEIARLPKMYNPILEQLVKNHYLVPDDYDEFQQVVNLRTVLQKLDEVHESKGVINHYTILPTTACNARCYYCFEQGIKPVTMTEKIADDVVNFIKTHCGGKNVLLSWFGGEPTLAINRIDQICLGLRNSGVEYLSEITTNGYLLDERVTIKASKLWKLKSAMICVDGIEDNYNRTKLFANTTSSPYQIVMNNIESLLSQGIKVHLRMNFDLKNYNDFSDLVNEVKQRYKGYDNLVVSAHPILGEYKDNTGQVHHGSFDWFESKTSELNDIANDAGLQRRDESLPFLQHRPCMAASGSSVTITAEGKLVSCPEQFDKNEWKGDLKEGVTNIPLEKAWKTMAFFEKCKCCESFPACITMAKCTAAGNCYTRKSIVRDQKQRIIQLYYSFKQRL